MSIFNKYKDTLKNIIDSLYIKCLAILRQIDLSTNNIPGSKDNPSDPEVDDNLLGRSQRQQQCQDTLLLVLGFKSDNKKVKERGKKRDKKKDRKCSGKVVRRRGGILEVSIY